MALLNKLFTTFNDKIEYAVLRNWDGLPDTVRSRDIDFIIRKKEYPEVSNIVKAIAHEEGWKIIQVFHSERFNTIILGDTTTKSLVQLDFFFHTSAHGIIALTADEMLKSRVNDGEVYHVSETYEFLEKFLFNAMVGIRYPDKYLVKRRQAETNLEVASILKSMVGIEAISDVEKMSAKSIRRKILFTRFKDTPIKQIFNIVHFLFTNAINYVFHQGFTIGFTGPDGVGKTTVMNQVIDRLSTVFSDVQLYHFRPTVIPNLGDAMHDIGLKKVVDHEFDKPHRGKKTNVFSSVIRLFYYISDYFIGYWIKVKKQLYRRSIIVFDRYFTDIITDSKRSRIFLGQKFMNLVGILVPKLNYNFLVVADAEVILNRKQELSYESVMDILGKMKSISEKKGYYLIENNGSPETAVNKILEIIYNVQDERYSR